MEDTVGEDVYAGEIIGALALLARILGGAFSC